MKLDELLEQLLEIANNKGAPSAIEVQLALFKNEPPQKLETVTYKSPDNEYNSPNNWPRIILST